MPFGHIEGTKIENKVKVGPYARLREGTHLMSGVKIGNFVGGQKNQKLKKNSKVNHFSYIGDTLIGKNSNIGAGTITCNYDGLKNMTTISDNVFLGSNSSLVLSIKINRNAVVGAGSVITKDVKNSLSIERSEQEEIENYKRKK